jgi:hypothetical protein
MAALLLNLLDERDDMKSLMITGALAGFLAAIILGLTVQNEWPSILWNASLAALVCGVALRWWSRVWVRNLYSALRERSLAAAAAKETKASAPARI